jgi:hypothetical protein
VDGTVTRQGNQDWGIDRYHHGAATKRRTKEIILPFA